MKKYKGFKGSGYNNSKKIKKRNKSLTKFADKMTTRILSQFGIEKKY